MGNEPEMSWDVGLADEERKDLENLIEAFQVDRSSTSPQEKPEELQKQMTAMKEKMTLMSAMLLDLDKKTRSLYEVLRLFHKKTEVMNQRISDVAKLINIGKKQ
ncbi:MAG TPA: hypothetical protein P5347_03690 [Smithellaceae bacterium]|nr:hypothetical protein [Smithellaceae bacterium]HRY37799.1 hypothetical protein [Smithellaceae bacterium]